MSNEKHTQTTIKNARPVVKPRAKVRRAKTMDDAQIKIALAHAKTLAHASRAQVMILLSVYGAMRAQEIAWVRWNVNLLDSRGKVADSIHITSDMGKWGKERTIPMHPALKVALMNLRLERPDDDYVVYPLHANAHEPDHISPNAVVKFFKRLYVLVGFNGCTSHSGRRTFITMRARQANLVGCSLVDVQKLAGHQKLETTAAYIDPSDTQRALVAMDYA